VRFSRTTALRERLKKDAPLVLPGAYDALSARLIGQSGAEAVYVGGFASVASAYGVPDVGLIEGQEMVDHYEKIVKVIDIPVIVDIDTGYGSAMSVRRTVKRLIDLGIAGFHIEDQVNPKRCGHFDKTHVVPIEDAVGRINAAIAAAAEAGEQAPLVIARTDALRSEGLDRTIERIRRFGEAGADVLFVDAIPDIESMRQIRASVEGVLLFNGAATGRSPQLSLGELKELGYSIVIYPIELMLAAIGAAQTALAQLGTGRVASEWYGFRE
jgi:2-methylisocitrate lyase-like PEP mutase family enzyme